jgi:hypothetical protein
MAGTTSAGSLGTPDLPRYGIDMNNNTATGVPTPKLLTDEAIAKICHQANKSWCEYNGDNSQPNWEDAPDWARTSAINGVKFHRENPNAGDSASHESWMQEKVAEGWIYGKVKDPEASPPTHPCIVPFEELPREQQFKDRLFRTVVHAALA